MTAEIINLAEYRKKKQRREAFKVLEQRIAYGDLVVIPTSPFWNKKLEELPNFPPDWIAVDMSFGYKPTENEDK